VIIGLQQFAPLSMKPLAIGLTDQRITLWDTLLLTYLNRIDKKVKYNKVNGKAFEELYISMYASNNSEHVVLDISFGSIKTCDAKTKMTGGLILNCTVQNTKLSFINCYLSGNNNKLFEDLKKIYYSREDNNTPQANQVCFIFGDLGFGLELNKSKALEMLKQGHITELFKFDNLWKQYKKSYSLPEITESEITFRPTYRLVKRTKQYDVREEEPCWRDRILWIKNKEIVCKKYSSVRKIMFSTNSPVYGLFSAPIYGQPVIEEVNLDESFSLLNSSEVQKSEGNSNESQNTSFIDLEAEKNTSQYD